MAFENNVLYFIALHHKSATKEKIIEMGKGYFTETQIVEAKINLLKGCHVTLDELEHDLLLEISKTRNNSETRDKLGVIIEDIIKVIKAFEGHNKKLDIKATDMALIPTTRLEATRLLSITTRVDNSENSITALKEEMHSSK